MKIRWTTKTKNDSNKNNNHRSPNKSQMLANSTTLSSFIDSSSSSLSNVLSSSAAPVRTRTVVNAIYVAGIAFMIGIFLLLLWVNLFSRHCWCWHDTSVVNRFNRQWLIRRPSNENNDNSSSAKNRHQRRSSNDDELPWTSFSCFSRTDMRSLT